MASRLLELLETDFSRYPILVVGDVMLDQYLWGAVERISPEAPVPVLRSARRTATPGGAANVAMNLAGLGVPVKLAGLIGADDEAAQLGQLLESAGIPTGDLCRCSHPTISKTRIMAGRQQLLRLDVESNDPIPETESAALLKKLDQLVPSVAAVIISDYAKGVASEPVCRQLIAAARRRGIPVLVDPKGRDFTKYRGATTLCPNFGELAVHLHGLATDRRPLLAAAEPVLSSGLDATTRQLLELARTLLAPLALEYLTVTLSEHGIALVAPRPENDLHLPAQVREVRDVSGAGDTVIALLALAAAARWPLPDALALANLAAGVVVGRLGTVPIDLAGLRQAARNPADLPYN